MSSSLVWKYFTPREAEAECTRCKVLILRGKNPKSYSTKPLWNHLQTAHKGLYAEITPKNKIGEEGESSGCKASKTA